MIRLANNSTDTVASDCLIAGIGACNYSIADIIASIVIDICLIAGIIASSIVDAVEVASIITNIVTS
jgi:hypothetical protein